MFNIYPRTIEQIKRYRISGSSLDGYDLKLEFDDGAEMTLTSYSHCFDIEVEEIEKIWK